MILNKLNKKVISYWILKRSLLFVLVAAGFVLILIFVPREYWLASLLPCAVLLLITIIYAFVMPPLEYNQYGYFIDDEKIIIKKGVFFKYYLIIPLLQVQDIGTFQGPIQILFNISNINIATAGSTEQIICVDSNLGKEIVEKLNTRIHKKLVQE